MNAVKKPSDQGKPEGVVFLKIIPGKDQMPPGTSTTSFRQEAEERRLLPSFSADIAAVRNKNELLRTIDWKLKNLLGFSHFAIGMINEDKTAFNTQFSGRKSQWKNYEENKAGALQEQIIADRVLHGVLSIPELHIYDLDRLVAQEELPVYLKSEYESGIKQATTIRFSRGNEVFGFWMIFFEHQDDLGRAQTPLINAFAKQVSTAVYNILCHEKVAAHEIEINHYKWQLEKGEKSLNEKTGTVHNYPEIKGKSSEIQEAFRLISLVAPSDCTVLIGGESGTGKELVARSIHNKSRRKDGPMVTVNCAALPANLIESELFGHERGSFTGAFERRIGKFELANKGTLFLDEIGELPLELQAKLLRVLQEREIERVGGKSAIKVNVRIIAATNRDLEKEVREGKFRSDLYYRLNVFPIYLAPLRNRREDIPLLTSHFIFEYSKKNNKKINGLGPDVLRELMRNSWPGNIRELEHLIERSILRNCADNAIEAIQLPSAKQNTLTSPSEKTLVIKTIAENECDHILNILKYCKGKIEGYNGAAEILGVPTSTLNSKIKRLGIRREDLELKGT